MGQGIYLTRSQSSSEDATARKKFTISVWFKKCNNSMETAGLEPATFGS